MKSRAHKIGHKYLEQMTKIATGDETLSEKQQDDLLRGHIRDLIKELEKDDTFKGALLYIRTALQTKVLDVTNDREYLQAPFILQSFITQVLFDQKRKARTTDFNPVYHLKNVVHIFDYALALYTLMLWQGEILYQQQPQYIDYATRLIHKNKSERLKKEEEKEIKKAAKRKLKNKSDKKD